MLKIQNFFFLFFSFTFYTFVLYVILLSALIAGLLALLHKLALRNFDITVFWSDLPETQCLAVNAVFIGETGTCCCSLVTVCFL